MKCGLWFIFIRACIWKCTVCMSTLVFCVIHLFVLLNLPVDSIDEMYRNVNELREIQLSNLTSRLQQEKCYKLI